MEKINYMNECHYCIHKKNVPGNTHIQCVKPDSNIKGSEHGFKNGWFFYPLIFDPVWKLNDCNNYENKIK